MCAVPQRRRRQSRPVGPEMPSARYGTASVVAIEGTGRLRRMARNLTEPQRVPRDPYGYEAGLVSLRKGGVP